jgi:uncharacterized protein
VTDLAITGRPAQFGRGVMEEVGQKLINQFADCLATTLGEDGADEPAGADVAGAEAPAGADGAGEPAETTAPASGGGGAPSSNGSPTPSSLPSPTAAPTPGPAPRAEGEAIDLLSVAGAPVAKRVGPLVGGLVVLALLWWLIRRR